MATENSLGRDKDPKVLSDINTVSLIYRKVIWSILSFPGQRFMGKILFPESSISHMDVDDAVAFTIDDGFCGLDNPDGCMVNEVRELFKKYEATATFFITGSHCSNVKISDIHKLLSDGHELANHNMYDYPYNKHSKSIFLSDLNSTHSVLSKYTDTKLKWYRAPHAKISDNMQNVIDSQNMIHVISDAFANDTAIPDPEWISKLILNQVKPGSIIVIHMPERNIREWNYKAMELTLSGLKGMNLDIVNLTELEARQNSILK